MMKIQRLKDGRLRDAGTGRILKDATPYYKKNIGPVSVKFFKGPYGFFAMIEKPGSSIRKTRAMGSEKESVAAANEILTRNFKRKEKVGIPRGFSMQDAGLSDVQQISKQLRTISDLLKEADMAVRDLARNVRIREDDIDDETVNGLGISLDRIQKAAKQAEMVLRKFI